MIRPPDQTSPVALADWLEVSLLGQLDEPHRISDAEINGALQDADIDPETEFANLRAEIGLRIRMLGEAYPVLRDGQGFARRGDWQERLPYAFLLLVSLNQFYEELVYNRGTANRPAEIFENLTSLALRKYVPGKTIRMGASRRDPVPAAFPDAVRFAAVSMNEEFGYGELEIHDSGDDGLDVIAWCPHIDNRPSQLIIMAQCAIGTDWHRKRDDLQNEVWRRHIRWQTQPVKAFSVPFFHPQGNSWTETAVRGGIIFDRLRIAALVEAGDLPEALSDAMIAWCQERLHQVAGLALG